MAIIRCFEMCSNRMLKNINLSRVVVKNWYSSKTATDIEKGMIKKLIHMNGNNISYGIKKSVKNGFINKNMFNVYNELVIKFSKNFNFHDVVIILQAYALCKERNFRIYSLLSNRTLYIFKNKIIEDDINCYHNIYKYILASNQLNYTDFELMIIFLKKIKTNLNFYNIKQISILLHSLAKLKINDEELLQICNKYILENFDLIKWNYINHILSAYSKKTNSNYSDLCFNLIKYIYENIKKIDSITIYNVLIQMKNVLENIRKDIKYSTYFLNDQMENTEDSNGHTEFSNKPVKDMVDKVFDENDKILTKQNYSTESKKNINEYCYLDDNSVKTISNNNSPNYTKHVLKNIIPLLFTKVNICIPFLSVKQLIKLIKTYKELNYFNYIFIYKKILHYLLSKLQNNKISLEENIEILEFFTILPFVNDTMETIINIITEQIENNLVYNYNYLCRLLYCCDCLCIHSDNILSKIDCLIFKEKKKFEKDANLKGLQLFLKMYNKENGMEWGDIIKLLNLLIKEKKSSTTIEKNIEKNIDNSTINHNNNTIVNNSTDNDKSTCDEHIQKQQHNKVIIYKYNKIEKKINENEINLLNNTTDLM
ncbi:conserved protein, unknown function [Hepatocystis sp. ex Piliocolobus tephrosceles]|nr:conserved protein, unknown function [Hepatocystis sp. ex Piliocolobus tephrosceles]